jgi:hypothetical protein
MKRRTMFLLVTVLVLSLATAAAVQAKAPSMGDRSGVLDLTLNLGDSLLPAGITWYGTVVSDEVTYDIVYWDTNPEATGVVTHWSESWEVFYLGEAGIVVEFGVVTAWDDEAVPLMTGFDTGITHLKNSTWLGNGPVPTAEGPFAQWEGHRAHTRGDIDFATLTGTGTLRLN